MKKILTLLIVAMISSATYGQDDSNRGEAGEIVRGPYETNRFFDNWNIGVGAGVNIFQGANDKYQGFGDRLSTALDISLWKWITPSVGVRGQYSGLKAKGSANFAGDYSVADIGNGFYSEKFNVMNLHTDVLWNVSNAISGYREDRRWNFIPYIGFGWARSSNTITSNNELAVSVGLLNTFRLSNCFDLTLEARQMFTNNRFDNSMISSCEFAKMTSVTVGVSYKFGKRRFKRVQTPNYTPYNERIAILEADNEELMAEEVALATMLAESNHRKNKVVEIVEVKASPVALFFKIGEATLDAKELVNLDFYVKNAIELDKNKTFTIIGGADKETGTDEFNKCLSRERMQYVYDLLVDKYSISPDRLVKVADGDSDNMFKVAELNRTVIIK